MGSVKNMRMIWKKKRGILAAAILLAALLAAPVSASAEYAVKELNLDITQEKLDAIPPVLRDRVYEKGDDAIAVEVVKLRLQELGYYKRMDTFNTRFDETMLIRLKMFQKNNAIEETGVTDETTMAVLFSDGVVTGKWYQGEDVKKEDALIFPATNSVRWYKTTDHESELRASVRNISRRQTVKSFTVSLRAEDAEGNAVEESVGHEVIARIAPGETVWTSAVPVKNRDMERISAVYMAITEVEFADGTRVSIEEPKTACWRLREGEKTDEN